MASMIDSPFSNGEGRFFFDENGQAERVDDAPAMTLVTDLPDEEAGDSKNSSKDNDIEISILDDTPPEDRGRPIADIEKPLKDESADEEIKQYSKSVQERFNQMTARAHAERRAAEQHARERDEAINHLKRINAENNRLKEILQSGEKALMDEHKGRLDVALKQAKAAYREASDAGDHAGMAEAQAEIARAVAQMEQALHYKPMQVQKVEEADLLKSFNQEQTRQPQAAQPSQEAVNWQMRNQWFGTSGEEPMSNYAMGVHQQILREGKVKPDTKEYFEKIDQELHKRFPDRFQSSQRSQQRGDTPPRSIVAGPGRIQSAGNKKVVQLTESQVRLAKRLNLTPQQYAAQLIKEQEASNGKDLSYSS
jgi:hypothetical protein